MLCYIFISTVSLCEKGGECNNSIRLMVANARGNVSEPYFSPHAYSLSSTIYLTTIPTPTHLPESPGIPHKAPMLTLGPLLTVDCGRPKFSSCLLASALVSSDLAAHQSTSSINIITQPTSCSSYINNRSGFEVVR